MNANLETPAVNRASGAAIGFLVASMIFIVLVVGLELSRKPVAIDADRAAIRSKDLAEIQATETAALDHAGWIDQQRGIVRLPIATALQLAAQAWQDDPTAARADLLAREKKATATLPKVPAKPSAFE